MNTRQQVIRMAFLVSVDCSAFMGSSWRLCLQFPGGKCTGSSSRKLAEGYQKSLCVSGIGRQWLVTASRRYHHAIQFYCETQLGLWCGERAEGTASAENCMETPRVPNFSPRQGADAGRVVIYIEPRDQPWWTPGGTGKDGPLFPHDNKVSMHYMTHCCSGKRKRISCLPSREIEEAVAQRIDIFNGNNGRVTRNSNVETKESSTGQCCPRKNWVMQSSVSSWRTNTRSWPPFPGRCACTTYPHIAGRGAVRNVI